MFAIDVAEWGKRNILEELPGESGHDSKGEKRGGLSARRPARAFCSAFLHNP